MTTIRDFLKAQPNVTRDLRALRGCAAGFGAPAPP